MDGPHVRDVDAEPARELGHRPGHAVELKPLAGLKVLQH